MPALWREGGEPAARNLLALLLHARREGALPEYVSKFAPAASRGEIERTHATGPPAEPTDALPGTAAKVAVLEGRAKAGTELWHELDQVGYVGPEYTAEADGHDDDE